MTDLNLHFQSNFFQTTSQNRRKPSHRLCLQPDHNLSSFGIYSEYSEIRVVFYCSSEVLCSTYSWRLITENWMALTE